jgi:hypothetical protein
VASPLLDYFFIAQDTLTSIKILFYRVCQVRDGGVLDNTAMQLFSCSILDFAQTIVKKQHSCILPNVAKQ